MSRTFSGHIHIFHAFDIGEDIDLELIKQKQILTRRPLIPSKYFKNYHKPLLVELPHPHTTSFCESVKLYPFGVLSLHYKVPFNSTLEKLRKDIAQLDNEYREQSVSDASLIYKNTEPAIKKATFFHISKSYLIIQLDTVGELSGKQVAEEFGGMIVSILRFEDEQLSEHKKDDILKGAFGYYRGDLIVIDTDAAFLYDDEFEEALDLFEFVNIQHLELQYFDRILDKQLTQAYNRGNLPPKLKEYMPLWGTLNLTSVDNLGMLKVEISVITERLENSIKLAGEPYYSELYSALSAVLDLENWKVSIERKLTIVRDISSLYESRAEIIRGDIFNVLITVLIFMELMVGIIHYWV